MQIAPPIRDSSPQQSTTTRSSREWWVALAPATGRRGTITRTSPPVPDIESVDKWNEIAKHRRHQMRNKRRRRGAAVWERHAVVGSGGEFRWCCQKHQPQFQSPTQTAYCLIFNLLKSKLNFRVSRVLRQFQNWASVCFNFVLVSRVIDRRSISVVVDSLPDLPVNNRLKKVFLLRNKTKLKRLGMKLPRTS